MNNICKVSVIVPVYNVEEYLALCLDSLAAQTFPKEEMEVLLINDGSPDNCPSICEQYAAKYSWIRYFSKENEGLSTTRNYGLARAEGKYLMFLDSDDTYTPETVQCVTDFFDEHYDEVDLVAFRHQPYRNEKKLKAHYRYRFLRQSGIYDLDEFPYITQTNLSVCTKNLHGAISFDAPPEFRHEDQKYCFDNLRAKMKFGFCDKGEYCYNKNNENSIVATYFYAYYIFESTTAYYEELFGSYPDRVPPYVQAMFFNDINWKTRANILFPTHYSPEKLQQAKDRLHALLLRVDDDIILTHPGVDTFHAQYFLRWKLGAENVKFLSGPRELGVVHEDTLLYTAKKLECFITKFRLYDGRLRLIGFLKSPVFNYTGKPKLFLKINGFIADEQPLRESSWGYYKTKEKTNTFWGFHLDLPVDGITHLSFVVELHGRRMEPWVGFLSNSPFQPRYQRTTIFWDGLSIGCGGNEFTFRKATPQALAFQRKKLRRYYLTHTIRILLLRERFARMVKQRKDRRIWLYYDCANVLRDNGYYQFIHDLKKNDGVERYYIVNDDLDRRSLFDKKAKKQIVRFGSKQHQTLFVQAEKIITAFIEPMNYIPLAGHQIPHTADFFRYELVYLQHGVLHAHQPWKYSLDRLTLDREVISTTFEQRNMTENYGFTEMELLPTGMPRYDHIDRNAPPKRKILYAPSWRKYLVAGPTADGWKPKHSYFKSTDFFLQSRALFSDPALIALLEEYDFTLDVQLHPILGFYKEHYDFSSDRVRFSVPGTPESDYAIFITDISSFVFDFAYLKRPILYFMPDNDFFRAGLNDYRELDIPLEEGFGPLSVNAEETIADLRSLLANNCEPVEPYRSRVNELFLDLENCCEKIYDALK